MLGRLVWGALCVLVVPVCLAEWPTSVPAELPSHAAGLAGSASEIPEFVLPAPDVAALLEEDRAREATSFTKDRRVGLPRKVAIGPAVAGAWNTLENEDRLWRARVRSPGARWLVLGFTTFRVPEGARLYVYAPDDERVQGPFGSARVREHGQLWSTPVEGDTAIIELFWPRALAKQDPNVHLGILSFGYRPWGNIGYDPDDPPQTEAGACNIDINCPLGDDWQDEKHGGVLTLVGGARDCSGSLIAANSGEECKPYMLSAHHCHGNPSEATSMSLMFNFERPGCETGTAPTNQVHGGGGIQRATYSSTDFTLIEMNDPIPSSFDPYWNGWSRVSAPATETWGIHHPRNDEKKICYNDDPAINGSNYGSNHWRVTEWEQGTTEGGSSGSPLFDQNSRIVGQLHGGTASCSSITWDEYGKLSDSWEGGGSPSSRLRDWLDPNGTGEDFVDGTYGPICGIDSPSLKVSATNVDDITGNGDGIVDPDELFTVLIDVENSGSLDATTVSGTLTVLTAEVSTIDGASDWPDIPVQQTRTSDAPHFQLQTSPAFVCGTTIQADLFLTSTERPEGWTRPVEIETGTPNVATVFEDSMESGVGTWTTQSDDGTNVWSQSTSRSASPSTSWFVSDVGSLSDQSLLMEVVDPVPAGATLKFVHRINSEGGFDGGVLEYRVASGAWQDAGALITLGGYTSTISSSYSSALGGRQAWSGDNGNFVPVEADLSTLEGQSVQFRWRFATDTSVSDEGGYVDDVTLDSTSYSCQINPVGEASAPGSVPFTVSKDPGGYLLEWSAPQSGGSVVDYVLYENTPDTPTDAVCVMNLGNVTSTVVASLPSNGLIVVARNGAGEGSYGEDSAGNPRTPASGPNLCP